MLQIRVENWIPSPSFTFVYNSGQNASPTLKIVAVIVMIFCGFSGEVERRQLLIFILIPAMLCIWSFIYVLLFSQQIRLDALHAKRLAKEEDSGMESGAEEDSGNNEVLWVEKFKPRQYLHLLSDEVRKQHRVSSRLHHMNSIVHHILEATVDFLILISVSKNVMVYYVLDTLNISKPLL